MLSLGDNLPGGPAPGAARTTAERPLRVLMVVDSLRLGGAESILAPLARAAPAGGFVFEVASLDAPDGETATMLPLLEREGVPTHFLSLPRLVHPRSLPALVRLIRRSSCDVVHGHLEHATALVPPAAALTRRAAVCTFHHVARPMSRRNLLKERLAIEAGSRGDAMLFVSRASMDSYADRYGARRTWDVLHNGVDLHEFATGPSTFPSELRLPPSAPVVTIVAALRARKGHADALAAWPGVLARHPDAFLLLVGSGPEEGRLRARAHELQIQDRVVFAGLRSDVARILRASTLVALPTQVEALPTVLIEAAAAGRAAVATDIPGVREVLLDGVTGLTARLGDVGAFERNIVRLLADPALRTALGQEARRRAESHFGMDLWARRLTALYERVTAGRERAPSA
jgi:glycosyltransferase involved in cell wall biosynthesis